MANNDGVVTDKDKRLTKAQLLEELANARGYAVQRIESLAAESERLVAEGRDLRDHQRQNSQELNILRTVVFEQEQLLGEVMQHALQVIFWSGAGSALDAHGSFMKDFGDRLEKIGKTAEEQRLRDEVNAHRSPMTPTPDATHDDGRERGF